MAGCKTVVNDFLGKFLFPSKVPKFLQTSQKKYQGLFYCLIEKHMQKFRHF